MFDAAAGKSLAKVMADMDVFAGFGQAAAKSAGMSGAVAAAQAAAGLGSVRVAQDFGAAQASMFDAAAGKSLAKVMADMDVFAGFGQAGVQASLVSSYLMTIKRASFPEGLPVSPHGSEHGGLSDVTRNRSGWLPQDSLLAQSGRWLGLSDGDTEFLILLVVLASLYRWVAEPFETLLTVVDILALAVAIQAAGRRR
jgi:hypothetical protein